MLEGFDTDQVGFYVANLRGFKNRLKVFKASGIMVILGLVLFGSFDPEGGLSGGFLASAWAEPSYAGFGEIDSVRRTFVVVGDTQSTSGWEFWRERNDQERKRIIEEITRREPAFVVHVGDLTTRGSSEKHWQEFDQLHQGLRGRKIPYFPVLGNHEFYGKDEKALALFFARFPHLERRRWYSFAWKGVGLVFLDSNFSKLDALETHRQQRWYQRELEKFENDPTIDFILTFCHEPPFTNSRVVGPNKRSKKDFADPFLQFRKTALFFSGHSHSYERFQREGKSFIVTGGGGGPRHRVITDRKKQRGIDLYPGAEIRFFHFCEVKIEVGGLQFRVVRLEEDGTFRVIDALFLPCPRNEGTGRSSRVNGIEPRHEAR